MMDDNRQDRDRLRAALDRPVDETALSRAVLTRLAAAPAGPGFRPSLGLSGAYVALALLFCVAGYQGAGLLDSDPLVDLTLGSVTGVLQ